MSASSGLRRGREQRRGRHDLARLAVAALDHFELEPGLLHLRAGGVAPTPSIVVTARSRDRADRQHAGAHRLAVEMHGAGAALRDAAAELGAGHAEHVAQHPEQRHVRRRVERFLFAIDRQRCGHKALSNLDGRVQRTRHEASQISRWGELGSENIFRNADLHCRRH